MKQRFIIAMILTIVLSTSLVVPVHVEGMARNTVKSGAEAYYGQVIRIPNHQASKFVRCVFNRRIIITSHGIYLNFGKPGKRHNLCLY